MDRISKASKCAGCAAAVALSLSLLSCKEMAVPPAGSYSEVLLVTEEGEGSPWVAQIVPRLSRDHDYVIDMDKAFRVSVTRASELDEFPVVKNIVICGIADPLTDVGKRITTLIGEEGVRMVRSGRANILKKENLPAPGQLTLIITAPTEGELERTLEEQGDELEGIIESSCRARLRRFFLSHPNREATDHLFQKYGFAIEIPILYRLFSEASNPPGVELLRESPTRLLGIFWVDWPHEPTLADTNQLFEIRKDYVWERYDRDAMDSTRVWYSMDTLGPYPAVKMEGYWYNTKAPAGGYYTTYFVYEKEEKLIWAIDLLVYAPGFPKHALFRELLSLAETFRYD